MTSPSPLDPPPADLNFGSQPLPAPPPAVRPPLRRSSTDKMAGVLVYLLLWVLMPPGPRASGQEPGPLDRLAEQAHDKVYATGWLPPRR